MAPAFTSVHAALLLGNTLGGFVKGVTGFGSAILVLCVWVVCTVAGANAGTLQQAVLTECVAQAALALPLLVLTRAHQTCNWGLVASLSVFGALGAPMGAALLTHLPPRQTEFAVACLVLVVVVLNVWQSSRRRTAAADSSDSYDSSPQDTQRLLGDDALPSTVLQQPPAGPVKQQQQQDGGLEWSPADSSTPARTSSSSSSSSVAEACCVCVIHEHGTQLLPAGLASSPHHEQGSEEAAVLLCATQLHAAAPKQAGCIAAFEQDSGGSGGAAAAAHVAPGGGWRCRVRASWQRLQQPQQLAQALRSLLLGSLAGLTSGVMAGLTGIGGPPVMLLFERMRASKDCVRGTNAVCGVLQPRLFVYVAMGAFVRSDAPLYAMCAAGALAGAAAGCLAAGHMRQGAFSHTLTGLMCLCCALMFASASGLAGTPTHDTS